jgi:hypothetical protein
MGTTAHKIARNIVPQMLAQAAEAGPGSARQISKAAKGRADELIKDGLDPSLAVYAHTQSLISMFAEHLSTTKEARQFARIVAAAEDTYMPSYPPISPVTHSHFAMWSLFDVEFGQSRETIGTCFLHIAKLIDLPASLQAAAASMQASRLGLYVHCGHDDRFVTLREVGSDRPVRCFVPAGYRGEVDEIWLARLLPPAGSRFDYHVAITTPYIIIGEHEPAWLAYLDRERRRIGSKALARKMDATAYTMKYGPSVNHWNEYIFCAYAGHRVDAVFLTGIPDNKKSLPHA